MDPWRTAIATSDATNIWIRGHAVTSLMQTATFTDVIVLLHLGRLPSPGERRLLDALLIGVADHGAGAPSCAAARLAASGNRASISSAIAAGILAIGDDHGGAGSNCMELIARYLSAAKTDGVTPEQAAARAVDEAVRDKRRLPGLGHRVHTTDPRVNALFELARKEKVAGDAIVFMRAMQCLFSGPLAEGCGAFPDLLRSEKFVVVPVTLLMFAIGIAPQFIFNVFNTTVVQMARLLG